MWCSWRICFNGSSITGCAVHTLLGAGVAYGTIDLNIKMIRTVPKDENLIAEGNVNQNL